MAGRSSRTTVVATCAAAALALTIPAAGAAPPDRSGVVERAPIWSPPLFWDGELIVLVGPPLEQGCLGEGFRFPTATIVTTPGGDELTSYTDTDSVWVFDDEDVEDPLDWLIGRACAAVWSGAPAPEPLASGEGKVIYNVRARSDGDLEGNIRFTARVTTADGDRTHLNVVGAGLGQFPDYINYGG